MPAGCSPSDMPGGSGRKVIAAQAGGAFAGAFAAAAGAAVRASATAIPTEIVPFIVLSSSRKNTEPYTPAARLEVELRVVSRSVCDGRPRGRSEEHTSELQSPDHLV